MESREGVPVGFHSGIRQRNLAPASNSAKHSKVDMDAPQPENMGTVRAIALVISMVGVATFSALAVMFGERYAFFGFHGNMEEAAASCWQTATLFGVVATCAAFPSLISLLSSRSRIHAANKKYSLPTMYKR
eukprot:GFKZ01000360.1.p4 GENE.GFKZ01000360.1~~GFKZ01000360.1.p4  ORF type:complete len:132 (-),score=18.71 GFKZ01000360.1:3576-3971(-)